MAWSLSRFKPAAPASTKRNLLKTATQGSVFWLLFVVAAPLLLVRLESIVGLEQFEFPSQTWSPWIVFVPAALLNLYSGYSMATLGHGTPLPTDCARSLVLGGAYGHVRNPMGVGGLLAMACVGCALGSPFTIALSICGGVVWNVFVRPIEERELEDRFGADYAAYKSSVRCWVPRFRAYRPMRDG